MRFAPPGDRLSGAMGRIEGVSWALALITAAGVLAWGIPRLQSSSAVNAPNPPNIEIIDPPVWVDEDLAQELRHTVRVHVSADVFDQSALANARAALMQTGWFESVHQVRRTEQNRIMVDARFVRPFVLIRDRDADHLVDIAGHLLPRSYASREHRSDWVIVTGARYDRPPQPGRIWEGADIAAAMSILQLIDREPWRHQVHEIDVSHYLSNHTLVLATDRARIVWGSAPNDEQALEPSAETKVRYLSHHFKQFGRIDRGLKGDLIISPYGMSLRR